MTITKSIVVPSVLLAVGAGVGPYLPSMWHRADAASPTSMKVGVVKMAPLLDAHWRRMLAAENREPALRAFQVKAKAMQQKLDSDNIRHSSELENLKAEYAVSLDKWNEQGRTEIERAVKKVAEQQGLYLVYCDAVDAVLWSKAQRNQNLAYFDHKKWSPIHLLPAVDVTRDVVEYLRH